MAPMTLYHNPRCSKSRSAMKTVQDLNADCEIVEYLKDPPDERTLLAILKKLGDAPPIELVRTHEARFKELDLDRDALTSAAAVARLLAKEPALMQRPVLVKGDRAVIGRPEAKIAELLEG